MNPQSTDFPLCSSLPNMLFQMAHPRHSPALVTLRPLKLPRFIQLDEFRKYFEKVKITRSFKVFRMQFGFSFCRKLSGLCQNYFFWNENLPLNWNSLFQLALVMVQMDNQVVLPYSAKLVIIDLLMGGNLSNKKSAYSSGAAEHRRWQWYKTHWCRSKNNGELWRQN